MSIILGRRHRLLHVRALLAKRNGGEQEICPVHHGSLLDSQLLHKERATPRAPLREEEGDHEYYIANSLKKKCKKKFYLGIHDRFIRDEKFRKNMFDTGRTEEMSQDGRIGERRPHAHLTPEEIRGYRANCVDSFKQSWFRYDASPASTRLQASIVNFATAHRPRGCSSSAKMDAKLLLVLVELARFLVASFIWDITATMDPALIDRRNLRKKWLVHWFVEWFSELMCRITVQNSVTANSSYCHRRGV